MAAIYNTMEHDKESAAELRTLQENIELMFSLNSEHLDQRIEHLNQSFSKQHHSFHLVNFCFRCHHQQISKAYNQFRIKKAPALAQPRISKFYDNSAFVNINSLSRFLSKQLSSYCQHIIQPIPPDLPIILDKIFNIYSFIPSLERFLLFYPTYLQKIHQVWNSLLEGSQIDRKNAYFLAFCGAAQLGSTYMMARFFWLYKKSGGEPKWIEQGCFPQKYQKIIKLNHIMGRSIWQINEQILTDIMDKSGTYWNSAELSLCIEILAFSHHLSTLALGMGFVIEWPLELIGLKCFQDFISVIDKHQEKGSKGSQKCQQLSVVLPQILQCEKESEQTKLQKSKQPSTKFIKNANTEDQVEPYMKQIGKQLTQQEIYQHIHNFTPRILPPYRIIKKRREHLYPPVDYSECNFTFTAYPLLNSLTNDMADKLSALIDHANTMARNRFGTSKEVSTREFRKAMVYYGQNLCGYKHPQYDYKNINVLLTIAIKFFIRLLTISPVDMTAQVIREINHEGGQVECFDLGHTAILIANMKLSLELTLTMRVFDFD